MRNHAKASDATDTKVGLNYGWRCKNTLGTSDHSQEMDCRPALQGSLTSSLLKKLKVTQGAKQAGFHRISHKLEYLLLLTLETVRWLVPMEIVGIAGWTPTSLHQHTESSGKSKMSEPVSGAITNTYKFRIDTSQGKRTQATPEMFKDF